MPTSVFPCIILGCLEAGVLTLDCRVSHLDIINSCWVSFPEQEFLIPETYWPQLNAQPLGLRPQFGDQAQAKGIYSILSAQLVLSGAKLQIFWCVLLLTSAWLGFSLSHIFMLPKQLLTWKGSRQKFPFKFGFCVFLRRVLSLD